MSNCCLIAGRSLLVVSGLFLFISLLPTHAAAVVDDSHTEWTCTATCTFTCGKNGKKRTTTGSGHDGGTFGDQDGEQDDAEEEAEDDARDDAAAVCKVAGEGRATNFSCSTECIEEEVRD